MSFKHIDMEAAFRRLADRRIEDAMKEGKFDNLSGTGRPLNLDPAPAEENARLLWWALRILRNNDFTPDEVCWRKSLDGLKAELAATNDESRVEALVEQINEIVRKINTLGTNAMNIGVAGVDRDEHLARIRSRPTSNASTGG